MHQKTPLLTVEHLFASYGASTVLEDISFSVYPKEFFCIIGPNGSGKSTLIRSILGLKTVTKGTISLNCGRSGVAYVPQTDRADAHFPATVWEIVLTGTQCPGGRIPFYTAKDKKCARQAMETFEISHLANSRINELSGGQRQRMFLARALCRNPSLLLLDEPCAGLDEISKKTFYSLLGQLDRTNDTAIIMVSHDLNEVEHCANRVAVLSRRLLFLGTPVEWREKWGRSLGGRCDCDYHSHSSSPQASSFSATPHQDSGVAS